MPRENGFGAAIRGINLSQPLTDAEASALRAAWYAHRVVSFPDQALTHGDLERFAGYFGDFGADPYIEALPDHPHILELRREPDEKALVFGASWHSDWSFLETPPAATILHAKVVPPVGGDTLFADGYAAYDALTDAQKVQLEPLSPSGRAVVCGMGGSAAAAALLGGISGRARFGIDVVRSYQSAAEMAKSEHDRILDAIEALLGTA